MPAKLATLFCWSFILFLFWMDRKQADDTSKAQWVPMTWMFLAGSRFASQWLSLGRAPSFNDDAGGSPIDALVFLTLMVAGVMILKSRRIKWGNVLVTNKLVWLFFLFGLLSITWSPFPFISFKRWFKALGNVIMALVLLTEPRPFAATGAVVRRIAFVALPLSILFIKYYPQYGRMYHMGLPMFTGVAMQKNTLGQLCLLTGLFCVWNIEFNQSRRITLVGTHLRVEWVLMAMVGWLMYMADSATSLMCLVVALLVLFVSQVPVVRRGPRRILGLGAALLIVVVVLELTTDLSGSVIAALGRNSNLTTRVPMWYELLGTMDTFQKRLLGYGFEAFWLTDEGFGAFQKWIVFNAHNGYLDTYLSFGYVGLSVLLAGIVSTIPMIARNLGGDRPTAILKLSLVLVVVLYNWTESTFKSVDNMWLLLFLTSINPPVISPQNQTLAARAIEYKTRRLSVA